MKPFKKILGIVALSTALVAGLGVAANAKTTPKLDDIKATIDDDFKEKYVPKVQDKMTVFLYKDSAAKDNAMHWKLDPATSVIPIKNMAWDADFKNISTDTQQVTVKRNKTGQYYLNIECSKYIKPNKKVTVKWAMKQHGIWFNLKTELRFAKAPVPYTRFTLTPQDGLQGFDLLNDTNAAGVHLAWQHLRGVRTLDFWEIYDKDTFSTKQRNVAVRVRCGGGYSLDKLVVTKKDGHSYTIKNGDRVNIDKIKTLQIKYKASKNIRVNTGYGTFGPLVYKNGWLPKESNGYPHLFDVVYVQTIKF
jgi:hypothetical protein